MLVFMARYVSFLGLLALFGSVVPQILMFYRGRRKDAAVSWLLVSAISAALLGPIFALNYLFVFILYGIVYGIFLKEKDGASRIVISAASVWCLLLFVWVMANYLFFGLNPLEEFTKTARIFWALNIGRYYDYGIPVAQITDIENMVSGIMVFFTKSAAGWSVITGLSGSWFVYYLLRRHIQVPALPSLTAFRLPDFYIWALMLSIILYMAGSGGNHILSVTASNLGIVLIGGYILSGLGLVIAMMGSWNFTVFTKVFALLFIILFLRGVFFFLILGVIDVWADFRKRLGLYKNR